MQLVIIFAIIVAILAVLFAFQNPNIVTLHLFAWSVDKPLALFLLIAFLLGALVLCLLSIPGAIRHMREDKKHRKIVTDLEDNLSKYRSNLIDAQNSNKDLRQKILEIEDAKVALENAQKTAEGEINDLHEALNKADLSKEEAEQARKEALDARREMDLALRELESKLNSTEQVANTYKGLLQQFAVDAAYSLPGNVNAAVNGDAPAEVPTEPLSAESAADAPLDAPADETPAPADDTAEGQTPAEEAPAEQNPEPEKKGPFSWF